MGNMLFGEEVKKALVKIGNIGAMVKYFYLNEMNRIISNLKHFLWGIKKNKNFYFFNKTRLTIKTYVLYYCMKR